MQSKPCILDDGDPASDSKPKVCGKKRTRKTFSEEEDLEITRQVEAHGTSSWRVIANAMSGRTPRQVRERWVNYLSPKLSTRPWTIREDEALRRKVAMVGRKWSIIALEFPGRTDVTIKNRYRLLERHNFVLPEKFAPVAEDETEEEAESVFESRIDGTLDQTELDEEANWDVITSIDSFAI